MLSGPRALTHIHVREQDPAVPCIGNAMHAVRTQCEVLDVDKYSNPSFGPFSQVFGSVPGFFFGFLSI